MKVFPEKILSYQGDSWTVAATQSGAWSSTIADGGNSITVDAPVGSPVFVRLSDGTNPIATLPVSGTFWQATQPVSMASVPSHAVTNSGTFSVQSSQTGTWTVGVSSSQTIAVTNVGTFATQTTLAAETTKIIGTINIAASQSVAVTNTGTFAVQSAQSGTWNVTNISGSISLPTGASTAAKQPALGTAGTASADVITIQGIASMTAVKVDGSGVTQPISIASPPDSLSRPGWSYATPGGSLGGTTTTIKSGAGVMHALVINKAVISGSITIYDNTTGSGTKIATIGFGLALLSDPPLGRSYDISFATGLTVVIVGAAMDVTIAYR